MQLSKRLAAIAAMVTKGNRVVDVGCDPGYIPIYLMTKGWIPSAIAMDINREPLLRAKANIMEHGLSDYIETRLSDGVSSLDAFEGDTLVIAGMGGPLMERILSNGADDVLCSFREFILEPQSDVGHFRLFLMTHGYGIISENMILDGGKFYPVMKAVHKESEPLKPEELEYGPCLLRNQDRVLHEYLCREMRSTRQLISNLQKSQSGAAAERIKVLEQKINLIDLSNDYYCTHIAER